MSKKPNTKHDAEFALRDIVLAKVRGFPFWPAMIIDPAAASASVKAERPRGAKSALLLVRFFPKGDYAWTSPKDVQHLDKQAIDAFLNTPKRTGELLEGYRIALDPAKWEEEHAALLAEAEAEEAEMDVDQLEGEEDGQKPRKRKRDDGTGSSKGRKKSLGNDGEAKKKKRRVSKKNGVSADLVESEDDGRAGDSHEKESPGNKRKKVDKDDDDEKFAHLKNDAEAVKIKSVRHTLQKAFLGKNGPIATEMPDSDKLFKELEGQEISIEYLSFSKIGKVMRHIASLDATAVPHDAEYNFRTRAADLVTRWHKILGLKANGAGAGDDKRRASKRGRADADGEEAEA